MQSILSLISIIKIIIALSLLPVTSRLFFDSNAAQNSDYDHSHPTDDHQPDPHSRAFKAVFGVILTAQISLTRTYIVDSAAALAVLPICMAVPEAVSVVDPDLG